MKKYAVIVLLFCVSLLTSQTTVGEYRVKNVSINTKNADFGTAFYGSDSIIFASPKNEKTLFSKKWKPNGQPYLDLFIGAIDKNGNIISKREVKGNVNTKFHEADVVFTKDLKTVYFTANNYRNDIAIKDSLGIIKVQLFKADVQANGEWTNIVKLPFNNDNFSSGHPALSIDDKNLYFISDRPESIGETDVFVVEINEDGTYSNPKNLGLKINTKKKEMFPFINENNILYFSSNGHNSKGGLDIFVSKIYDNTVSEILSLGEPMNSVNDDFALIINRNKGYFSSNRAKGNGDDDIYFFTNEPPIYFECNQVISGIIRDKETQELLLGATIVLQDEQGNVLKTIVASSVDASFSFTVTCNTTYKIVGTIEEYIKEVVEIKTVNDIGADPLNLYLDLSPEFKMVDEKIKININTIYFDLDKWNIRQDAADELDKLVKIMKDHPEIIVRGESHTDSRAREAYNEILSQKRAMSTIDYILSKGIDSSRITAKGYGEMQLVNKCSSFVECYEDQHQDNRRTEFFIINNK